MSRRKSIVIRTAKAWNLSFGQTDRLEYPAELARAIRRWQRTQDLDMSLPAFPESPQDMDMCMPDMYSSGSELNVDEQPEIQRPPIIPPSRRIRSLSPGLALRSPLPAPRHALPRSSNATPRAKLRHEDSQIQFEPIHSSPPSIDDAQESQNLTEHQKEVTERQHLDATSLYSDLNTSSPASILRSSPAKANKLRRKPAMTSSGSMNAKLRSSSSDENHEELDRPSTPQLAPPDIGMSDDLPGSSPTPSVPSAAPRPGSSSTHVATPIAVRQLVLDQEIFDPPSSPPKASEEADVVPDQDQQEEPRIDEIQVEGHEEQQDDLDVTEVPDIGAEEVLVNDIAETSNFETAVEAPDNSAFVDAQIQATDFAAEKQQHIDEALPNQTESHQDAGAQTTGVIHSVGAPTEALDEGGSIQVPVEEDSSGLFSDTPSSELPAAQLAAEYQEYVERRRSQVEASQNEASTHKDISELFPTIGTAQSETAPTEKADVTNPDDVEGQQEVAYDADSHIDVPATAENRREDGEEEMSVEEAVKVLDSFYAPADDDERDEDDEVDDGGDLKGDVSFVSASSKTTGTGTKRKATPGTRRQPRKVAKIQMKRSPILRRGTPSETSSVVSAKVYRSPIGDVKFYNPDGPDVRDCIVVALPGSKRGKGRPKRSRKSQNASENAETGPPAGATSRVESTYGRGNLQRRSSSRLSRTSASPEQDPTDQLRPIPNPVRRSTSNLSAVSSVPVQNTENAVSPAPKRGRQGRRSQTSEASGQVDNKALADTRVQVEDTPAQPPVSKKRRIEAAVEDSPQPESQTTGRRGRPRRVFSHVQVHSQGENANFDTTGQFEDAVESQPRGNAIDRTIIPATKDHPVESKREQEANIIPATEVQIAEDATTTEQPSPNPIATPRKRKREASMAEPHMTGASLEVPTESGTKTPTQLESQSATPARSPMREILTPSGILRGLKKILSDCKEAVLGSQEEREMDDVLFEIRKEVYEAGKRRKEGGET